MEVGRDKMWRNKNENIIKVKLLLLLSLHLFRSNNIILYYISNNWSLIMTMSDGNQLEHKHECIGQYIDHAI